MFNCPLTSIEHLQTLTFKMIVNVFVRYCKGMRTTKSSEPKVEQRWQRLEEWEWHV